MWFLLVDDVKILPGSMEVLRWLQERGTKIGVATMNSRIVAQEVLTKTGIMHFADAVFYRDSPGRSKPYPDHVLGCLKEMKCSPEETMYVGDGLSDMEAAKAAGVYAVGISGIRVEGYAEEEIKYAGAKKIIKSLSELPSIIRGLEALTY